MQETAHFTIDCPDQIHPNRNEANNDDPEKSEQGGTEMDKKLMIEK